ncbi:LysR family transcriptional regulator [Paenibacillus filicis]|uniref:LysR family transcriptional regulator n=1 Tax=Paenibacillus filicis TaxID=669464 RepID=A0ABU9DHB1_9BACL
MNLQQLKVFVLAVDLQKLYLVAEKLQITQPTVTFHLNKLQDELGVSLFQTKSYHVIRLTEAGKALYHYALQMNILSAEIASQMDEHKGMKSGRLSIGSTHTPATYMIPQLLQEWKQSYPQLRLFLDVRPASYILEQLKSFELDIGIISHTHMEDPDLICERLIKDDLVIILPAGHPLALTDELTPAKLAAYPCVSHEDGSISRKLVEEWAVQQEITLDIAMEVSGSEALKAAVFHGLGFGMVSESSVKEEEQAGRLVVRPIPYWLPKRYIYAVMHKKKLVSPAQRLFWRKLEEAFRSPAPLSGG